MSSMIEQQYHASLQALTPVERVERSAAMFAWTRDWLARQIVAECGQMPDERLKWEVALRLYGSEPEVRSMIEDRLQHVPR